MSQSNFPRIDTVNGQQCIIVALPIETPELSTTGKTYIISKTGWLNTGLKHDGKLITVNATAMIPRK